VKKLLWWVLAALAGVALWYALGGAGGAEAPGAAPGTGTGPAAQPAADTPSGRKAAEAADLERRGEHARAAAAHAEAARLAEQEGAPARALEYRGQQAVCLKLAGDVEAAHRLMLEVLAQARATGDRRTEGLALGNLVRLESLLGNPRQGLSYLDELAAYSAEERNPRLEIQTLEQAADGALMLGEPARALERIDRALAVNAELPGDEVGVKARQRLLSLKGSVLVALGDDTGADALWGELPQTGALLGNRARQAALLGLHARAADLGFAAAQALEAEGPERRELRDQALLLGLSELLEAGDFDGVQARLEPVLAASTDEIALAPFHALRARLALRRGTPVDAPADLARAHAALAGTPAAEEAGLLLGWALLLNDRVDEALATLEPLPPSHARQLLQLRALTLQPPDATLIREALPDLAPERWSPADRSLAALADAVGPELPSLAFAALDAGITDSERLRAQGNEAMAGVVLQGAARDALCWQALQAVAEVPGRTLDETGLLVQRAWVARWVERRQPAERALIVVLPGRASSYLLLCTHELGATSFAIAGRDALAAAAAAVVDGLRTPGTQTVAAAAHALYSAVLPRRALEDLQNATHWTLILPPELLAAPPPLWVTTAPGGGAPGSGASGEGARDDGAPVAWLVRERVLALLPHAPTPATPPDPDAPRPEPVGWLSMGSPAVDRTRLPLVAEQWFVRYGEGVFEAGPPKPVPQGVVVEGAAATAVALRQALPRATGLQLSLPGAGGGRLGGLLFAPAEGTPWGDETAGFLPWHRCAQLALPPQVVLDGTRFDPADARHGPGYAASALLAHAREALFTRWPPPGAVRDGMVRHVHAELAAGRTLSEALAAAQRSWLDTAEASGETPATHPRMWAAWLPWGDG
jgi:hypothetical protein